MVFPDGFPDAFMDNYLHLMQTFDPALKKVKSSLYQEELPDT